ncbi:hypothetical protein [Tissierella praeacuta]|uniref:hypothetical protein n=1 Tax=Tissierella praeacuta TaxID=43131 RepID=UPI0028A84AC5|nr:hypothetical protein [Tissierella praeacuta]
MIKKVNCRVGGKKTINKVSVKRTKISKKMMQGKVITSQLILRQSREEITNTKQYQDLMSLLK